MTHLHFHHLAILVAALAQWFIGALWYSLLFAKPWMALTGHVPGSRPKGAVFGMVWSLIASLILCFVQAHVIYWAGASTLHGGLFVGFLCWLGFIAMPLFSSTFFERRPVKLFAITGGFWLVAMLVSGVILAVWR